MIWALRFRAWGWNDGENYVEKKAANDMETNFRLE